MIALKTCVFKKNVFSDEKLSNTIKVQIQEKVLLKVYILKSK